VLFIAELCSSKALKGRMLDKERKVDAREVFERELRMLEPTVQLQFMSHLYSTEELYECITDGGFTNLAPYLGGGQHVSSNVTSKDLLSSAKNALTVLEKQLEATKELGTILSTVKKLRLEPLNDEGRKFIKDSEIINNLDKLIQKYELVAQNNAKT
jgi:hypothetical protein